MPNVLWNKIYVLNDWLRQIKIIIKVKMKMYANVYFAL